MLKYFCITLLVCWMFAGHIQAQDQPNQIQQDIESLIANHQYQQAYDLLAPQIELTTSPPQILFLYGVAARAIAKFDEAANAFREILRREPDNGRVKLELASLLVNINQFDEAFALLNAVKDDPNTPPAVLKNVDLYLASIAQRRKNIKNTDKPWFASVSAGFTYDSNVNNGPGSPRIELFGLPFTLSEDAIESDDWGYVYSAQIGGTHNYAADKYIRATASLSHTDYHDFDALDARNITAIGAFGGTINQRWSYDAPLRFTQTRYGHENPYHDYSFALSPRVNYIINKDVALNSSMSVMKKYFYDNDDRDTSNWGMGAGIRYKAPFEGWLRLSARYGQNLVPASPRNSYDQTSLNLDYNRNLLENIRLTPFVSASTKAYRGLDDAQDTLRKDRTLSGGLSARYHFLEHDIFIDARATHTRNHSNHELYDYHKNSATLTLTKQF